MRFAAFITSLLLLAMSAVAQEYVVLLHGLCRSSRSLEPMRKALEHEGYSVINLDYPSRTATVTDLSEVAVGTAMDNCRALGARKIHFVTHSLGGLLVRSYFSRHSADEVGRVVMLGPPNQGSEVADRLKTWKLYSAINGPAGQDLGTTSDSLPNRLGPPQFSAGVISGNRSINWINSLIIPGPDDGKVSVERTKVAGMADHIVISTTHPFMMRNREVIRQSIAFLRTGSFDHSRDKKN
jgi:pimeloyl-ACP methyl ester carboxylesterase